MSPHLPPPEIRVCLNSMPSLAWEETQGSRRKLPKAKAWDPISPIHYLWGPGCGGRGTMKSQAERGPPEGGSSAGLGPFPPLPNSLPRGCSDLPLPEPAFPHDEREKDGKWEKAYS